MAAPAKKKPGGIDLAVIMGGPPKGKPEVGAGLDDDGVSADAEMAADEGGSGAFDSAYEEFNDPGLDPEERKAAFKRAVMACMEGDY